MRYREAPFVLALVLGCASFAAASPATGAGDGAVNDGAPNDAPRGAPPSCAPIDPVRARAFEVEARRRFVGKRRGDLVVDFGCDSAGAPREVVYESGSGHAGTLVVVRLRREAQHVQITRLTWRHYAGRGLVVERAVVGSAAFDRAVAASRVGLVARLRVVEHVDDANGLGLSGWVSSHDFHVLIRVADDLGRVTERRFTGYESSLEQEAYIPLTIAASPLQKLLGEATFQPSVQTDEERVFVAARSRSTAAARPEAWVQERYAALASLLGVPKP